MKIDIVTPRRFVFPARVNTSAAVAQSDLGGIETACLELASALSRRGHSVRIIGNIEGGPHGQPNNWRSFAQLADLSGDVLISCNDAILLNPRTHHVNIAWLHNPISIAAAVRRGQLAPILSKKPHAIFGSVYHKETTPQLFRFRTRNVIPLGITECFSRRAYVAREARAPRFCFPARFSRGLRPLVQGWSRDVSPRHPEASLHVFGSSASDIGEDAGRLREKSIVFHERQSKEQLACFYDASIGLVSAGYETFCLAAAEAQAAGLPVVALGVGALRERVTHGVNGLLCDSPDQIPRAISLLATNAELWLSLSRGARATGNLLRWDLSAALWEEHIRFFLK